MWFCLVIWRKVTFLLMIKALFLLHCHYWCLRIMLIYFLLLTCFLLGLYEKVKGQILMLICLIHSTFNKGVLKNEKGEEAPTYPPPPPTQTNEKKHACLQKFLLIALGQAQKKLVYVHNKMLAFSCHLTLQRFLQILSRYFECNFIGFLQAKLMLLPHQFSSSTILVKVSGTM